MFNISICFLTSFPVCVWRFCTLVKAYTLSMHSPCIKSTNFLIFNRFESIRTKYTLPLLTLEDFLLFFSFLMSMCQKIFILVSFNIQYCFKCDIVCHGFLVTVIVRLLVQEWLPLATHYCQVRYFTMKAKEVCTDFKVWRWRTKKEIMN